VQLPDTPTDYVLDVAGHLGFTRIDRLDFLALSNEVGHLLRFTNSCTRLGRENRRQFDVPGHVCARRPLIHEVQAVPVEHLGPGGRRDVGVDVRSACRMGRVPDPDKDSATSERVAGLALIACPRRKVTRSRHARRHRN
jgi:hypothetical protein